MKTRHTPTEWEVGAGPHTRDREVFDNDGMLIADCRTNTRGAAEECANAARIVACVNACEGINPEAVPELLEALKHALDSITHGQPGLENEDDFTMQFDNGPEFRTDLKMIRAALAKAEGTAE